MINVMYFGYRKWSHTILENLLAHKNSLWQIPVVYTPKDPKNILDESLIKVLQTHKPAVLLFYGWSWMIPKELYENYICIILHPSPLPTYRGGSPIQHQIIAGESQSAVTLAEVTEALDAGRIYAQRNISLTGSLTMIFNRIIKEGTYATIEVLDDIALGRANPIPQDESKATQFRRRKPSESEITVDEIKNSTAKELYNKIRALQKPYPLPYIIGSDGKKVFITGARLDENE